MITGKVDDYGRRLVSITVYHSVTGATLTLVGWIDTGFTATLLLPSGHIATLGLEPSSTVQGTVADGSRVFFDTYQCRIDWFGMRREIEAIAGAGEFALIGLGVTGHPLVPKLCSG